MFASLLLSLSLLAMASKSVDVVVVTLPKGDVTVPFIPAGKADLKREPTVTRVIVELDKLQPPSTYGVALSSYVAWAVSPEGSFENIGEIVIDKDKGRLDTVTRFDQVGVFVTAEPHYMVDRPSDAVVFRTQNPDNDKVRRQKVTLEVGAYDYSAISLPTRIGVPVLVVESRAALEIARNVDAERWAEPEFRRARASLDTTEQLASRASPLDIVAQSANETIRKSQLAAVAARERQASDLRSKLTEMQKRLVLSLHEDYYDSKAKGLTPAGREALARLTGIAEAISGQIRLDGPASDALFEAARQYLIQSGIPQGRITIGR